MTVVSIFDIRIKFKPNIFSEVGTISGLGLFQAMKVLTLNLIEAGAPNIWNWNPEPHRLRWTKHPRHEGRFLNSTVQ